MPDEIVFLYGWGPEEEGRFSSLLHLVETSAAMGLESNVFFFTDGVVLAKAGFADRISEDIGRRLKALLKNGKVKFYACDEAVRKRALKEEDLEEGIKLAGYATFLGIAINAKTVIAI